MENLIKQRKGFACKWHILRKHPNTVEGFSHSSSNNTIAGTFEVRNPQTMKDDSSTHRDVEKSNTFNATCACVCVCACPGFLCTMCLPLNLLYLHRYSESALPLLEREWDTILYCKPIFSLSSMARGVTALASWLFAPPRWSKLKCLSSTGCIAMNILTGTHDPHRMNHFSMTIKGFDKHKLCNWNHIHLVNNSTVMSYKTVTQVKCVICITLCYEYFTRYFVHLACWAVMLKIFWA